jgi:hypothetical protein
MFGEGFHTRHIKPNPLPAATVKNIAVGNAAVTDRRYNCPG